MRSAGRRLVLKGLLTATLMSGCASSEPSESRAFIEWASGHAIAMERFEDPLPAKGLKALREAIGQARVVALGESRHDTREQLLLKSLLVRHLIDDLGFRILVLEESIPHAEALDRYVVSGQGDLHTLLNELAGWYLWDTEEMLELLEWIRKANLEREPGQEIRIFGMDITAPALGVRRVLDDLRSAGIDVPWEPAALGLDLQEGDFWPNTWQRYGATTDERRDELHQNYADLIDQVESRRPELIARTSQAHYDQVRWLAEVGRMGNALFSSMSREEGGVIREQGMAQAVLRLVDREATGARVIVWTHNLHAAHSPFRMPGLFEGVLEPMGVLLRKELGDGYLAIGGTFGEGSYGPDLPPGARTFPPASVDVADGALAQVGAPVFLIDLRKAGENAGAARWLRQERELRAQDSHSVLSVGEAFDLLYFVETITRARPSSRALRRFQSTGESQ